MHRVSAGGCELQPSSPRLPVLGHRDSKSSMDINLHGLLWSQLTLWWAAASEMTVNPPQARNLHAPMPHETLTQPRLWLHLNTRTFGIFPDPTGSCLPSRSTSILLNSKTSSSGFHGTPIEQKPSPGVVHGLWQSKGLNHRIVESWNHRTIQIGKDL